MAKIALLTPTFFHYSGIDRVVEQQAGEYSKKGHEVSVFALDGDIKSKGYRLIIIGMPKNQFIQRLYRLFFFLDFIKIRKTALKLKDFDMAVSHFYPMNLIASYAKKKYGTKYLFYNHGIGYSSLFSNIFERLYMKLFGFFNSISLKNADLAVSISKFMQKELKRETGIESKVIYNKIDKKKFNKRINGNQLRKKLGLKNEKMLLFVGRLSPHKNIHSLLEIFKKINEKIPSRLIIVGKPTFRGYFKKLKNSAGKDVMFMEEVDDRELPFYYAACDLYVTASLWEGFNLPAAEAQAMGKKVVAFDLCSHPEIVKNGLLVEKNNLEAFANAAIKLLK